MPGLFAREVSSTDILVKVSQGERERERERKRERERERESERESAGWDTLPTNTALKTAWAMIYIQTTSAYVSIVLL